VCPRWLADQAEDLVQVGLMRIVEIRKKSEGSRELPSSYLYRVAHSVLVDEIRRRRRRREVPLENEQSEAIMAAEGADPERGRAGHEIGHAIAECLALMRRARRLAVTLHLQGHSVIEAARILGWSAKRTENLVYRGLADLRRCLLSKGVTP
jgi:RNA polymerase sigma-70 factor (ECF subfamily)